MLHKFPPEGEAGLAGIGGWGCRSPTSELVGMEGVFRVVGYFLDVRDWVRNWLKRMKIGGRET